MKNKKILVMSTLLVAIVLLGVGTIAYFRRTVNGNVTGNAGNLVLVVNEANAVDNQTFSITLQRSEEEAYIMPDDSGNFDLNIDASGSSTDVTVTAVLSRTNLPDNLKFYLDENYTQELTTYAWSIEKSDTMTKTIPVYWFWDGSVDDENDTLFINTTISASISVTATISKTLYETLMNFDKTIDTDVDFKYGQPNFIESDQCYEYDYQCDEYGNYCEELEQQCYNYQNGNGLMLREGTQSDEYPIVYYRGNVNNNNVIYAGYCWLIVRTTETGGIKLVYNGEVNSGGNCNNYSGVNGENKVDSAFITESIFNTGYNTPLSIGYMYNDDENLNYNISSSNDNLSLFVESYLSHLSDKMIDSETGRHIQNLKDSVIKEKIDEWYILNVYETEYEDLLEDTIWCNDRSVTDPIYSIENYEANRTFYFSAYNRLGAARYDDTLEVTPILTCSRDMDKFTVDSENGNGDLGYPIGLLTADEIILAGVGNYSDIVKDKINFLSDDTYWTLSPWMFHQSYFTTIVTAGSQISNNRPDAHHSTLGVKPSISLKNSTVLANGTGTFEDPYILAY